MTFDADHIAACERGASAYRQVKELTEKIARLTADNDYLKMLMQDIRNATDSQQAQSLLELRAENTNMRDWLIKIRQSKEIMETRRFADEALKGQ